jgi:hypothetical protein
MAIGKPQLIGAIITAVLLAACIHRVALWHGEDFSIYQAGGIRIYIASAFKKDGFIGMNSEAEYQQFFEKTRDELGILFERGLLTGRMFFKALGDTPPNTGISNIHRRELTSIDRALAADPGPLVKVLYFKDLSDPKIPTLRNYDLWITFEAGETGWGSFHHFYLELGNNKANAQTPGSEFSRGARLIKLEYKSIEL